MSKERLSSSAVADPAQAPHPFFKDNQSAQSQQPPAQNQKNFSQLDIPVVSGQGLLDNQIYSDIDGQVGGGGGGAPASSM